MSKTMAVLDDNNLVTNIIICDDDVLETNKLVIYTNDNPAYIGGDYVDGYFYEQQPFPSWVRIKGKWKAPVPEPTDGQRYVWNEETLSWVLRTP